MSGSKLMFALVCHQMTLSLAYQEGETDALVNLEEEEDAHIAYSDLGQGSKLLQRA